MVGNIEAEVCVIGGGPAGAVAALRLAQLGRQVCLVERAAFPRLHVGESLAASVWPILRMLGLEEDVKNARFLPSTGSVLLWGGAFERRGNVGEAGLLVNRGQLDALLLDAARKAAVQVVQPARAYRPRRHATGWHVPVLSAEGKGLIRAGILIDAAGKQAGMGRKFRAASEPLMALYAYWRAPQGFGRETRVEAGDTQWYWGAALPDGTVNACVFVDPAECTGLSPAGRRDLYLNLLARSTLLACCLEQDRVGPVRQCDATSLCETTPAAADLLRAGEASFSVDALSSQGVQLAMGQGIQAAVVANTVLSRPHDADLALSYYLDRRNERVETHAELAAAFYARQQSASRAHFWQVRAQPLEWLRRPPLRPELDEVPKHVPLRLCPLAKLVPGGVQTDTHIIGSQVLKHPNLMRPVFSLGGVELALLISDIDRPASAGQILGRWSERVGIACAVQVLGWLWQHRILVREGWSQRNRGSL